MEPQVNCTVSATTVFEPAGRIVRGTGTLTCDAPAALSLKVCLYSQGLGQTSWGAPLQCVSMAGSARTTLSAEAAIAIGPGAAKRYRTVVEAQVNSENQPLEESTAITAP
ncbi:hypothetical protein [Stigmatella erecta]|nr:hypothetical protein [Stigmatella erecta]